MAPQQAALGAGAAYMGTALAVTVAENTRLLGPIGQGIVLGRHFGC